MTVGEQIREARIKKGFTQEQLGELMGVQKSAVAKWENGRVVNIKRRTLEQLATLLEIPPHLLVTPESVGHQSANDTEDLGLSKDEVMLLEIYRQLSPQGKDYIHQTMDIAVQVYKKHNPISNMEEEAG